MAIDPLSANSIFFYIFGAWGKTGINCFIMITGYFMCKSHITAKKFLKLLAEIEYYKIVIYSVFVISGYEAFSLKGMFKSILPITGVSSGFASCFLLFFLCIPFLNKLIHSIDEKWHIRLVLLSLFIYTFLGTIPFIGVTMNYVSWFIIIYFIASYVRLYPRELFSKTKTWGIASIISILISLFSIVFFLYIRKHPYLLIADSNKVLAVVTAFCLFLFFKNIHIKYSRFINTVASATFGVLLIHANSDTMRQWLWRDTLQNAVVFDTKWCYLHFACSVIGIYILCTLIDLMRQYLLEKPFFRLYDRISPRIYSGFYTWESRFLDRLHID